MVVYNYSGKEINAKIVYYGPALSGKTTNLEWIYSKIPLEYSGKMISLKTQADRTIFFDFLPLELGTIDGFRTRFMLYTVPGQVKYNATRKMVLKGVDGVVFVADSEEGRLADNQESLQNLRENLSEIGLDLDALPLVYQWNKRDLVNCMATEELERALNPSGGPSFEASALTGEGVYETLHMISKMIFHKLTTGDNAAAQATAPGAAGETSLFGDEIASRLKEVDRPASPPPEEVAVPSAEAEFGGAGGSPEQDGAVLDAILGAVAPPGATASPAKPAEAAAAGPAQEPGATPSNAKTPPPTPAAADSGGQSGSQAGAQGAVAPASGVIDGSEAARSGSKADAEKDEEHELVSELVDHVLSPAAPSSSGRGTADPTSAAEALGEEAGFPGSDFDRMVDLDGSSRSAPGEAAAPPEESADAEPETPQRAAEDASAPAAAGDEEDALELITDPRKLKSEGPSASEASAQKQGATPVASAPSADDEGTQEDMLNRIFQEEASTASPESEVGALADGNADSGAAAKADGAAAVKAGAAAGAQADVGKPGNEDPAAAAKADAGAAADGAKADAKAPAVDGGAPAQAAEEAATVAQKPDDEKDDAEEDEVEERVLEVPVLLDAHQLRGAKSVRLVLNVEVRESDEDS